MGKSYWAKEMMILKKHQVLYMAKEPGQCQEANYILGKLLNEEQNERF